MTPETIQRLEEEIAAAYPDGTSTTDGGRRLIRLPKVHFPIGCKPEAGVALVVLDPNAPKPDLHLAEVPALPSGNRVSVGTIAVAGQTWQTFSFNLNWDEGGHTGLQFVEGKLARLRRGS
jgi:hypothetical protein